MVRMCPALNRRCKILAATKRIVYLPTNSFYQVLSAEAYSKHGFNIHGVVFDELHTQPDRKLFDVMTKGSGDARAQPLYFLITTAGTDVHSICYETHQKAKDILEGRKTDPTFYPVIYGAEQDDDWSDPKVWRKANPSLGITVQMEKVRAAYESARQNPAEENAFRQLRLNQWVKQAVRWMPMEKWDACKKDFKPEDLEGRPCYGGLDLSSTTDITAFSLVFPPGENDDRYYVLPFFWIPEENMAARVLKDHVPYDLWERQGRIITTEGNVIHYGFIERFIEKLGEKYNIREIAFDRWGAVQMTQDLDGMGFTVVPFGQGFSSMSPPTKELMNLVLSGRLAHDGNPVLRWMMDNVCVRTDPAGNVKMDKAKSTEKIDGAIATVMALRPDGPRRERQDGQGEVHREDRRRNSDRHGPGQGYKEPGRDRVRVRLARPPFHLGRWPHGAFLKKEDTKDKRPHGGQLVRLLYGRQQRREDGHREERHADDGGLRLRPHPIRGGGGPAAAPLQVQKGRLKGEGRGREPL